MAKIKQKASANGTPNLLKIVDPLQKLLDQRAALDAQIAEMKKTLIAAIETEDAPAKQKPAEGRKPGAKASALKASRGRKAGAKKPQPKKAEANEL